jgi:hypothetical protein
VIETGRQTRAWLIEDQHVGHEEATKLTTVAKALPVRPYVEAALLAGDISIEHARNIGQRRRESPTSGVWRVASQARSAAMRTYGMGSPRVHPIQMTTAEDAGREHAR